jgi:hypothetical protein
VLFTTPLNQKRTVLNPFARKTLFTAVNKFGKTGVLFSIPFSIKREFIVCFAVSSVYFAL